jgi:uncharacterized protein (TIGR02145 family)
MKNLWIAVVMLLLLTTCTQDDSEIPGLGQVTFKSVSIESFSGNLPNGRIAGPSSWKHIFYPEETLEITNKVTGETYSIEYNPNDFGEGFSIPLPYGSYRYFSENKYTTFDNLPFRVEGEFNLSKSNLEISLLGSTDHALITVKNEYVKEAFVFLEDWEHEMNLLEDESYYYIYAEKDLNVELRITEVFEEKIIKRQIHTQPKTHYNFFLKLIPGNGNVNFIELAIGEFESLERWIEIGENNSETFTDPRDGQVYKIVKIGDQIWMAENLNFDLGGSECFNEDPANCEKNGRLYDWNNAVKDACPKGWHIPDIFEWETLFNFLGGIEVAGGKMKSLTGWPEPNIGATNDSGFNGLPSLTRERYDGQEITWGIWLSSSSRLEEGIDPVTYWKSINLYSDKIDVVINEEDVFGGSRHASCRCIKD